MKAEITQEIRAVLDHHGPAAAERVLRAIDEGRFSGSMYETCFYGHVHGGGWNIDAAIHDPIRRRFAVLGGQMHSPLERYLLHGCDDYVEVRAEVVAWLAEHGTAADPTVVTHV